MRNQYKAYLFSFFSLAALLIGLLGTRVVFAQGHTRLATPQKAASQTCGAWSVVASPNPGSRANELSGVAAVSASDVWAVGTYFSNGFAVEQNLVEHWNGTSWSIVTSPNIGSSSQLLGVAAVSSSNIWAVGNYTSNNLGLTLIEHWNGTRWSVVTSPNIGSNPNELTGVAAVSASNVWAVGDYHSSTGVQQTLVEHWNGTNWSIVTSPNVGSSDNFLYGVAVSLSNVWAVGTYYNSSTASYRTLVEHWNGTSWSGGASPNVGAGDDLFSVAAVGSSNIWAVGAYYNSSINASQTLTEQWNGTSWSVVASPNVGSSDNFLRGVAAVGSSNIWAVGYFNSSNIGSTLIEHWNGTSWSIVTSPNPSSSTNALSGVAAVGFSNIWAVGYYYNSSSVQQTLVEFFC